jgi:hypothetical protein
MSRHVLSILAGMLVDEAFRNDMKADPKTTLKKHGFHMSQGEHEIAARIVKSFTDPADRSHMDDAIVAISSPCPRWPCSALKLVAEDAVTRALATRHAFGDPDVGLPRLEPRIQNSGAVGTTARRCASAIFTRSATTSG